MNTIFLDNTKVFSAPEITPQLVGGDFLPSELETGPSGHLAIGLDVSRHTPPLGAPAAGDSRTLLCGVSRCIPFAFGVR